MCINADQRMKAKKSIRKQAFGNLVPTEMTGQDVGLYRQFISDNTKGENDSCSSEY